MTVYPENRVISFGENGHMVLSENVVYVSGAQKLENGRYSLPSSMAKSRSALPQEGDVLMLNVGGRYTPVKVASAELGADETITIETSTDFTLSDVCDRLDIKGYMQSDGSGAGVEVGNTFNYEKNSPILTGR